MCDYVCISHEITMKSHVRGGFIDFRIYVIGDLGSAVWHSFGTISLLSSNNDSAPRVR